MTSLEQIEANYKARILPLAEACIADITQIVSLQHNWGKSELPVMDRVKRYQEESLAIVRQARSLVDRKEGART